ncbi:MAG: alkaline shock response membrane anchor protein AmaP [Candidatus Omnitrophica bacterium]|nr:alkaline shock response membrane anchor protein AmaP [Candidatus Omnitrophota bacterium]
MKFITRLAVLFYVTLVLFVSCFMIMFVAKWVNVNDINAFLSAVYEDKTLRMVIGILGGVILFMNFLFYQLYSVNIHRDKVIAFDNPAGRVSVSLVALEDLIKRMLYRTEEIKEVKASIRATRKGLLSKIKLALKAEVNIPDLTARVQDMVRGKIQDIIGLEEPIDITIYVGKILAEKSKTKDGDSQGEVKEDLNNVPFQGYRL